MPRPHLSQDPYNLERMGIMATIHEVIYLLRNTTNRVPQIIDMLNGIFGKLPNAISSSASERDYEFEICTRDLEQMIPTSISRIRRSDDENLKSFAKELIDCIPETLQNPALWDLEVGEATSEAGSAGRQHVRREDGHRHSECHRRGVNDHQTVHHQRRHHYQAGHHSNGHDPSCPVHGRGHYRRR
ncbi:hypothetical protein N7541_009809 [Penicillium brevicompactum]|uniref:Uncharacterized protein n=1 Tax=Penicillium brevicompactum TaxID=5074 RepID=A0A9W9UIG1_PENBR|nr:hypothetical protein N7541_009809 [Penicillium brevicompactum]